MSDDDLWPDGLEPNDDGADAQRVRVKKAPTAFRTISEVADDLHIPQHVLRFWEQRFPQVRPLKRGGGRRYYRPEDVDLLRRISSLLYVQGYTIKGVQRLLREGALLDGRNVPDAGDLDADDAEELPFDPPPQRHIDIPSRPAVLPAPRAVGAAPVAPPAPVLDQRSLGALLEELLALRAALRG